MIATVYRLQPSANSPLPGAGLPHERQSRLAALSVLVDLRTRFARAVASVPGQRGDWLRQQVDDSDDPFDLWLLRGAVFGALRDQASADSRQARLDLHDALSEVFPDSADLLPLP
jgi:hypothetical protein